MQLDGELVAAARGRFAAVSLAQRVYSRIRPSAAAQRAAAVAAERRAGRRRAWPCSCARPGKPLTDGIPGFFTRRRLPRGAAAVAGQRGQERGVGELGAGRRVELDPNGPADARAGAGRRRAVRGRLRAGLGPDAGGPGYRAAAQPVRRPRRTCTSSASPTIADARAAGLDRAEHRVGHAPAPRIRRRRRRPSAIAWHAPAGPCAPCRPSRRAAAGRKRSTTTSSRCANWSAAGAPIDQVLQARSAICSSSSPRWPPRPRGGRPPIRRQRRSRRSRCDRGHAPAAAARALAERRWPRAGAALRGGDARQQITAAFKAGGGPAALCPQVVNGQLSVRAGRRQRRLARRFRPAVRRRAACSTASSTRSSGLMSTPRGRAWKLQPVEGACRRRSRRRTWRSSSARRRSATCSSPAAAPPRSCASIITPLGADAGGTAATLDLGSATLQATSSTTPGPPRPVQITWPPAKPGPVSLSLSPGLGAKACRRAGAGRCSGCSAAAGRAVGRGPCRPRPSTIGDAARVLRFVAARNPFASPLLQEFRCPAVQ